jgi:hypothetical protein
MKKNFLMAALTTLAMSLASTLALAESAPSKGAYSTESTVGELVANEKSKAVLKKYVPELVDSPNMAMIESMSLKDLSAFPQANLNEEKLSKIQTELSQIK